MHTRIAQTPARRFSVVMPERLWEQLERRAADEDRSCGAVVRRAVDRYLHDDERVAGSPFGLPDRGPR